MHEMFEALHRKARAETTGGATAPPLAHAEDAPAADDHRSDPDHAVRDLDAYVIPPSTRALRIAGARSNRRRRWTVEFRGHRAGSDDA